MKDVYDEMQDSMAPADISEPDCDIFDHIGVAEVGMVCHLAEMLGERDQELFSEEDDEILKLLSEESEESEEDQVEMVDPRSSSKNKVEIPPFEANIMRLCGIK